MNRSAEPNSDKMRAEFRQKLENYQAAPSESLWDKIELSLDKEEAKVYKNHFRIYSRLAAACLLLLLGFAMFYIPHKIKQLNTETSGLSTADEQNLEREIALKEAPEPASEAVANSSFSTESTVDNSATKNIFTQSPEAQTYELQNITIKDKRLNPEKTVAFSAKKVKTNAVSSLNNFGVPPKNAIAFEPKTATVAPQVNTYAISPAAPGSGLHSTEPTAQEITPNPVPDVAAAALNYKPTAAKISNTDEGIGSAAEKTMANPGFMASDNNVENYSTDSKPTFPAKNTTVLENSENQQVIALKNNKPSAVKLPVNVFALPDTNILKTIPEAANLMKVANENNAILKPGKWLLALGYSGSSFHSGIRLASPHPQDSTPSNPIQDYNAAQYIAAIDEFNKQSKPAYSQAFSFGFGYKISENWLIQSGLKFACNQSRSQSHYVFTKKNLGSSNLNPPDMSQAQPVFEFALNDSFNPAATQIHETNVRETTFRFVQIGLPLHIRYQTGSKTFYYFAGAGATLYRLKTAIIVEDGQENIYPVPVGNPSYSLIAASLSPQIFRKWLPAAELQTGIGYKLTSHWQAEISLQGEQYLKPIFQNEHETGTKQQNPVALGAGLNVAYSF